MAERVYKLLDNATATGAGAAVRLPREFKKQTYQVVLDADASATMSAGVDIEVSNDGENYIGIYSFSLSGTGGTPETKWFSFDLPFAYVRGNVTSISGTGANVSLLMAV